MTGAVDVSVIMCLALLFPYIITSAVPHSIYKDPSLTAIAEPQLWPLLCVVTPVHLVGRMVAMSNVLHVGIWLNL